MNDITQNKRADLDSTLRFAVDALSGELVNIDVADNRLLETVRLKLHTPGAAGWCQGATIRPGFSILRSDIAYSESNLYNYVCDDHLKLHFKLSGHSFIGGERQEDMPVEPGLTSFLVQPAGSRKYEHVQAQSRERSITMICSREFAASILGSAGGDMPTTIRDFLNGTPPRFSYCSMQMHPQMRPIVEELLTPPRPDMLGDLMVEARALELLCLAVTQIVGDGFGADSIRQRDRKRVQDLCALLDADPTSSHSIAELSKLLAWNETQMMECFKRVTGLTIAAYRHRIRMDAALRELRETDASITEVAFNAGYEHPSNFATAFKRTFGFSPRCARTSLN